ncbi:MAG: ATP-binding cassette domain-containing protein [Steroidobacteraceae bacterium]
MKTRTASASRYLGIELKSIHLRLAGRQVLKGLNWRIQPGERWVLMGGNGAGKTQSMKLLAGDVWPTPGKGSQRLYHWRGEVLHDPYGIKQDIAYLGAERQDRYEHYEWNQGVTAVVGTGLYRSDVPLDTLTRTDRARIARLLKQLGVADLARRRFLTLSYGQRRLVLLCRALAWNPALLLMDELVNGLDAANRGRVLQAVEALRRSRRPWVYSCHRPEDIPRSATHLAWLEGGRLRWSGPIRRAPVQLRAPAASGAQRPKSRGGKSAPGGSAARGAVASTAREPVLVLKNAWVWRDHAAVLKALDLRVLPGECWVIHGANGSGKSSLLRAIYGDFGVASQGELRRRGIEPGIPLSDFKARVGFVAPELQSWHPLHLQAQDVVVSGLHSSLGVEMNATRSERQLALRVLRSLGGAAFARRTLRQLSYGQLRRVLFARALVHKPDILLLDEPYTGLDRPTQARLQHVVERAVGEHRTIMIVTHRRDEWPAGATHELQLQQGRAVYCGPIRRRGK